MTTLLDVLDVIEGLWPAHGAEEWDAPGLLSGDPAAGVSRILLAVDAVGVTVDEAVEGDHDLLLVHHPLLMRGVTTVAESTAKGAMLARLIRAGCALVAAHTNADVVATGTSGRIAALLGLSEVEAIAERPDGTGLGRTGSLPAATTLGELARTLATLLPATAGGVRVGGDYDRRVERVALCGGAGDSLLAEDAVRASDVYITSDLRHHPASEALETARVAGGPALIDVSHWASEWLWLDTAAAELRAALPGVDVVVSELRTDPWDFVVVQ
ncbi:MAG: Nif3-like dinuclear metal center hexameric protein [Microcella sp.]|uniref:Nif3-like dinuclear metal center hexameric protein n=1 Tax=Microcella sp. TaxID=1913979 RepID=UPI00331484AB